MHRSPTNRRLVIGALAVSTLLLGACGGGDDDDAAASATSSSAADESSASEPAAGSSVAESSSDQSSSSASEGGDTASSESESAPESDTASAEESSGDKIIVDDVGDLPQECVDLMAEMLVLVEPIVKDIDWETATAADFDDISNQLGTQMEDLDSRTAAAGCEQYDFTDDDASLQAVIDLAEEKAPGAVGWLEFIGSLSSGVSSDGTVAGAPTDCDGAITFIEDTIDESKTMGAVPIAKLAIVGQAMSVIQEKCSSDQVSEFFGRSEVTEFMSS